MRTRFPPSPTGFLHVGGLRTALFSWLVARQNKGTFILRIEDTDQARSVDGAIEAILEGLHWAGLDPDEGVVMKDGVITEKGSKGPYIQSQRLPMYKEHAEWLMNHGHAYRCFCTQERLEVMRKDQEQRHQAPMYDRTCLRLPKEEVDARVAAGEKHVIRLKVPREETITFEDDIRGPLSFQGHTVDDQVLLKSDGFPTYHLAHVVDDHFMDVDLVLRGEEWLSSLPKHLILFKAFGWEVPRFAHVALILNKDRTKLSKRQNSVAVSDYIARGFLPEALLNFLALLGWNPGTTQEIFTIEELIDQFSLERVQKAGAVFDEEKLMWLQGQWMRKLPLSEFTDRIRHLVPQSNEDKAFEAKAALIQERVTFFHEAPEMLKFFYERPTASMELIASEKQKVTKVLVPEILQKLEELLSGISDADWKRESILATVKGSLGEKWKLGQLLWPLRSVLTGLQYSPGAVEVAEILGKEETMERLKSAKSILSKS
jgi:nondiscriminating glutamyl-tRNA synthetase